MIRIAGDQDDRRRQPADHFGRRLTITHACSVAVIALMALGTYLTLERMVHVTQAASRAVRQTERAQMESQRIANLTAQMELGNAGARNQLRTTLDAFQSDVQGQSAGAGPQRRARSSGASGPLKDATAAFVLRARRIAAMSQQNAAMKAESAAIFAAARGPILTELADTARLQDARADREMNVLRAFGAMLCGGLLVTLLVANLMVFRPMARRIMELRGENDELSRNATTDPVTGTLNKRSFQARGAIEIQKARRYARPLSLLMIDADQLTAIEATHGSDGSETLLKALTSSFFAGTRVSDLVARVDAEQFAILLPETNSAGAELLAERLRRKISDLCVPIDDKVVSCTVSIGVAAAEKDASFLWPTFKRADEALYEAKMRGRNRVVVAA